MQSMADLDRILGAAKVQHLRWGCAKTVEKSQGAPLHYAYHYTNIKTSKSEGRRRAFLGILGIILGAPLP